MARIYIGTPAYEGKVYAQYAMMLVDMGLLLQASGHQFSIHLPVGGSLLVADRNRLVQSFWESGADYMMMIDSDVSFDPRTVLNFINSGKDFVAGVYPSRVGRGFTFRPLTDATGKIKMCPQTRLLGMESVPAGCMMVTRAAIQKMREVHRTLYYTPKDERATSESAYMLFSTELLDGEFWGEDYIFCLRARQAGLEIWVDPTIAFDHAGVKGALIEVLTSDPEKAAK